MSWDDVRNAVCSSNVARLKELGDIVLTCRSESHQTSLHLAVKIGKNQVFDFVLANYPELLFVHDMNKDSVLDYAINFNQVQFIETIVKLRPILITKLHPISHESALQRAVCNGSVLAVHTLLQQKPEAISSLTPTGKTLLHLAPNQEKLRYLLSVAPKCLLQMNADNGETALHAAVQTGILNMVQMLYQADPSMIYQKETEQGMTPFFYAVAHGQDEIASFFLSVCPNVIHHCKHGTQDNVFFNAQTSHMRQTLLRLEPNLVNGVDHCGRTPLHWALICYDFICARLVYQANPNLIHVKNDFGESPLRVAFEYAQYDMVAMFLNDNGNIRDFDRRDNSTLHMAVTCCTADIVCQVLQHHSDLVRFENCQKITPFQLAVMLSKFDLAKLLLPYANLEMAIASGVLLLEPCRVYVYEQLRPLKQHILPELSNIVLGYV